ncbi:MAG: hypothetical protein Q9P44_11050 [Anaerolineae bacterium]|nr:hypothetical protein [Anaerolineae bacterium]
MKQWMMILLFFALIPAVYAQDITPITPTPEIDALNSSIVDAFYTVDNDTPALGERIFITLTVDTPIDAELIEWPDLEGDEKLEILVIGEVVEQTTETRKTYRQETEAVLWDTGEYLSEEIIITYRLGDRQQSVPVRSFFAFVPSQIGEESDATLRPSAPPVDLPFIPRWTYGAAITAVIAGMFLLARLIQAGKEDMVRIVVGSPTQIAIAQLEDMKLQDLPAAAIYPLVADNMREYLQKQFGVEATEMTTIEVAEALQQTKLLTKNQRRGLQQLLEQADLVKFARFQPDNASGKRLINYAIKWLREAEKYQITEVRLND